MGKDILIEPVGNVRLENSPAEIAVGLLSLLGGDQKALIRLGSDVKITNRWHASLTLKSLTYELVDGDEVIASGRAKLNPSQPLTISSQSERSVPILLQIDTDPKHLQRLVSLVEGKRSLKIKGEAVVVIMGTDWHYPFEKDSSALLAKVLKRQ